MYKDTTDIRSLYIAQRFQLEVHLTDYSRRGHWRTLLDGTRTWVMGHHVRREPGVTHGYDADVFKRRADERTTAQKAVAEKERKAAQTANEKQKAALAAEKEREAALTAKARREASRAERKAALAAEKEREAALTAKARREASRAERKADKEKKAAAKQQKATELVARFTQNKNN